MKNLLRTLAFSIIIAAAPTIAVFGQQTTTTATTTADLGKEFDTLRYKAQELRWGKPHRITTNREKYADKNAAAPKEKNVSIYEIVPPDRSRYSYVYESDSKTKKYESITVGKTEYVREDGGNWRINKDKPKYGTGMGSRGSVKIVEKTNFNGQAVTVYEVKSEEYYDGTGGQKSTTRYWFSAAEGLLLKTEAESTDETGVVSKEVAVYEYDPNIKIEAPVVNNKQKVVSKP